MNTATRDIFAELVEGMGALKAAREGKVTLRTVMREDKPAPSITAEEGRAAPANVGGPVTSCDPS